jgi:hypothetical protein
MKMMDHAHGAKQVDVEHALYGNNVRIDSRHGVCYTTTKKERGKSAHAYKFSLVTSFPMIRTRSSQGYRAARP